mmetsp:Transcript_928/g.2145  ORF Transcript_928/g.2145 Transcript_928/m.2145 type:complete len:270 (+) Transcript_928:449-1258(+)
MAEAKERRRRNRGDNIGGAPNPPRLRHALIASCTHPSAAHARCAKCACDLLGVHQRGPEELGVRLVHRNPDALALCRRAQRFPRYIQGAQRRQGTAEGVAREEDFPTFAIGAAKAGVQCGDQALANGFVRPREAFVNKTELPDVPRNRSNVREDVAKVRRAAEGDDQALARAIAPDPALRVRLPRLQVAERLVLREASAALFEHGLLKHLPSTAAHRHELHAVGEAQHGLLLRPLHGPIDPALDGVAPLLGLGHLHNLLPLLQCTRKVS